MLKFKKCYPKTAHFLVLIVKNNAGRNQKMLSSYTPTLKKMFDPKTCTKNVFLSMCHLNLIIIKNFSHIRLESTGN